MAGDQPNARRLEGKVALVTAATAGIGLGIARRLGQDGAKVVICSRKQQNVEETVAQLRREGLDVAGTACHVGSAEQRQRLVRFLLDLHGRVDVVVCNAAVNPTAGPLLSSTPDAIDKVFDVNVKSTILLLAALQPHLGAPPTPPTPAAAAALPAAATPAAAAGRGPASIILVSSITAFQPAFPIALYAVSKTALLGLAKGLAQELGPAGVRVNCVAPGIVPTKFASYLVRDQEVRQAQIDATMLGRLGMPEDMAAAVAFLASDDSSYMTGETLVVAGGMQSRL